MLRGRPIDSSGSCLRHERRLTPDEYDRLWKCRADHAVWQWVDKNHFDGSRWYLEAHIEGAHVYGYERSPDVGALHSCASLALDLAEIPTNSDGRY